MGFLTIVWLFLLHWGNKKDEKDVRRQQRKKEKMAELIEQKALFQGGGNKLNLELEEEG